MTWLNCFRQNGFLSLSNFHCLCCHCRCFSVLWSNSNKLNSQSGFWAAAQTNKHSQQQHIRVHSVMQSTKTNVQNICENERNEPHIQILNPFMSWEHSWQKFVVQCVHSCQMTWFGQLFLKQTVFVIVWFSLVVLWLVTSTNVSVWCGDETEINWPLKLACFFAAAKTNIHLQQRHVGVSSAIVSSVMHQNKMLQFVVSKNIFGTAESAAWILKSFDHWN